MARRRARGRCVVEAERRNRTLCLQLWRTRLPLHGRSLDQRHWTSPRDDGKEHRGSAGRRSPAIQKNRKQKVESRRESCTFARGNWIAVITTGESLRVVIPAL